MIISRQQAIAEGRRYYYTGIPCKNGHTSNRYTVTCICVKCAQLHQKKLKKKLTLNSIKAQLGFITIQIETEAEVAGIIRQFAETINAYYYDPRRKGDLDVIVAVMRSLDDQYVD